MTKAYQDRHGERFSIFVVHVVSNLVNHRAFLSQTNWEFLTPSDIVLYATMHNIASAQCANCTSLEKVTEKIPQNLIFD